jgi:hypothetical protein
MSTQRWVSCLLLAAASVLAGCGGGSSGDEMGASAAEDASGKVPSSAMASIAAFVGFVGDQAPSDRAEPLSLPGATPPTSESAEPVDLD